MQLGYHFGKRKPRWNIFHEQTRLYFQSLENTILKNSLILSTLQFLILAPLLYWTLENYNLFLQLIPLKTHLKENLISEKNWILFLFSASYVLSLFCNYYILKLLNQKTDRLLHSIEKSNVSDFNELDSQFNDRIFSFDEAAARRRAS